MYRLLFFIFWSKLSIKSSNSFLIKILSESYLIKAWLVYFGFILTLQAKPDSLRVISATLRNINSIHYLLTYSFKVITLESRLEHFRALENSTAYHHNRWRIFRDLILSSRITPLSKLNKCTLMNFNFHIEKIPIHLQVTLSLQTNSFA